MDHVALRNGNKMPVLGLGTWQLTHDTPGTVESALRLGYRLVDTASDYGTQRGIGKAIEQSGIPRPSLYIATKIEETDEAYEATASYLRELGLQYADLMLIHRPPAKGAGEELWKGLIRAKRDEMTRDIGVSNYSVELMTQLIDATGEIPAVNQIEWSPFGYSEVMLHFCKRHDIIIQAYSPLTRRTRLDDNVIGSVAAAYNKSPAQILLRWNIQRGTVPIPKANQKRHLEENMAIFDFEISSEHMAKLDGLNEGYSSLGQLPYE